MRVLDGLAKTFAFYMEHILLLLRLLGVGLAVTGAAAWLAGSLLEIHHRKAMVIRCNVTYDPMPGSPRCSPWRRWRAITKAV